MQASDENQIRVSWGDGSEHLFTFPGHVFPAFTSNEMGSALGLWFQSNGEKGQEPHPELKEVMTLYKKAFGVPEAERIEIGKQIWRIVLDQAWSVGLVRPVTGLSGSQGIERRSRQRAGAPVQQPGHQDSGHLQASDPLLDERGES